MGALKKDRVSDNEWIERGAGPQAENYKSWSLTRSGLLMTFDPYSVASYAEGTKEVIIPFAALKNLINSQGPLAQLAK
ncbi:MAG: RsiV family protein [Pyrinomonadaceae bacterium]